MRPIMPSLGGIRHPAGTDIKGEHLKHADRQREPARRQRPHDERRQFGPVVGEVICQEPADVRKRGPTLFHRGHDGREIVV